jgi:hypothetical protein
MNDIELDQALLKAIRDDHRQHGRTEVICLKTATLPKMSAQEIIAHMRLIDVNCITDRTNSWIEAGSLLDTILQKECERLNGVRYIGEATFKGMIILKNHELPDDCVQFMAARWGMKE